MYGYVDERVVTSFDSFGLSSDFFPNSPCSNKGEEKTISRGYKPRECKKSVKFNDKLKFEWLPLEGSLKPEISIGIFLGGSVSTRIRKILNLSFVAGGSANATFSPIVYSVELISANVWYTAQILSIPQKVDVTYKCECSDNASPLVKAYLRGSSTGLYWLHVRTSSPERDHSRDLTVKLKDGWARANEFIWQSTTKRAGVDPREFKPIFKVSNQEYDSLDSLTPNDFTFSIPDVDSLPDCD